MMRDWEYRPASTGVDSTRVSSATSGDAGPKNWLQPAWPVESCGLAFITFVLGEGLGSNHCTGQDEAQDHGGNGR